MTVTVTPENFNLVSYDSGEIASIGPRKARVAMKDEFDNGAISPCRIDPAVSKIMAVPTQRPQWACSTGAMFGNQTSDKN